MAPLPHDRPAVPPRDAVRSLSALLEAIVTARGTEREHQCRRGVTAIELARVRGETLDALEDYATALEGLAWPVPRALLQEIRLHRALLGPRRRAEETRGI
jgi:hypothetical protein